MEQIQKKHNHKSKLCRRILLAAALIAALTATALAAYATSHAHTKALLEANPYGPGPLVLEEDVDSVLDTQSQDLNLTSTDHGHTVTLESVMGVSDEGFSQLYLTLQLDFLAEDLPGDASEWGFHTVKLIGSDAVADFEDGTVGFNGSSTTTVFEDGTVGFMINAMVNKALRGETLTLRLEDFGMLTKQDHESLFCQGIWEFAFTPQLSAEMDVSLEGTPVEKLNYALAGVQLSPFHVCVIYDQTAENVSDAGLLALEKALDGAMSLDAPLETLLQAMEDAVKDGRMTQEQAELAKAYLEDPVIPRCAVLRLSDGTERPCQLNWPTQTPGGSHKMMQFAIPSPVDLSQVAVILLDGVEIPCSFQ